MQARIQRYREEALSRGPGRPLLLTLRRKDYGNPNAPLGVSGERLVF